MRPAREVIHLGLDTYNGFARADGTRGLGGELEPGIWAALEKEWEGYGDGGLIW